MRNGLVVKDNALINASYNLETAEQRLILLAIMNARDTGNGITADSKLEIHASEYAQNFNVSKDAAYKALKDAVNNLFERRFSYIAEYKKTGKTGVVRSRWISRIFYVDDLALLEITFAPDVVPLITRLEECFTTYQFKQITKLTSKYAIRLYELLIAWRDIGNTPQILLADFRNRLGIEDEEYLRMHHLKARVLDPAIKQINEHTDITVTYDQHKKGRTITGFSFQFKQKTPKVVKAETKDKTKTELFCKLTDAQINKYSNLLARLPELSDLSNFPDYPTFALYISNILRDPKSTKNPETAERIFKTLHEKTDFSA